MESILYEEREQENNIPLFVLWYGLQEDLKFKLTKNYYYSERGGAKNGDFSRQECWWKQIGDRTNFKNYRPCVL